MVKYCQKLYMDCAAIKDYQNLKNESLHFSFGSIDENHVDLNSLKVGNLLFHNFKKPAT